jgi:hypothetical protein
LTVSSVLWESTTMISEATPSTPFNAGSRRFSSLKVMMTAEISTPES